MNSVLSPPRSFHFFGNLIFSLLLFNLLSTQVARCETKPLTGVTLRGPNNTTSFTLDTNAPGQTSSATLTASAHTPDGETTMRIPNMNFASGFRFEWVAPSNVVQYKKVGGQWTQMTANDPARGTVSVAPQRVGYTAIDRLFPQPAAGEAEGVGSMMESAIVTASFPLPGEYRLDVGVTANWWSGTGDEWEGDSNNGLGFPVYMTVMDIKMTFTGLARACAGGVAVDGVHDFTITGTSKDSNGVLAPDTKFTFSFEKNRGHNYQAGESADNRTGVLHRTKFLPDPAKGQVAVPGSDDEAMTATSNAQGQISIHVLSSDIISDDIKIVAKWKSVGGAENDAGTKACQFAPTQSRRGFIDPANPNQNDDNGWIFDIQRLRYNDNTGSNAPIKDTATASVYLQYKIDYNGGDDASNWEQVNGHEMLFAVDSINVRNGKTILPDKNLYVLFTLTRADGATFAISKKVGNVDGVAAATVKSGPKVADAETIEFIAYDQSQWRN